MNHQEPIKPDTVAEFRAALKSLPPLRHQLPGKPFCFEDSELWAALIQLPGFEQFAWSRIRELGDVAYDAGSGTWRGKNWTASPLGDPEVRP